MISSCIISEETPRTTKICRLAHISFLDSDVISGQDQVLKTCWFPQTSSHTQIQKGQGSNVFVYHPTNQSKKAKLLAVFVKHHFLNLSSHIRIQIGQTSTVFFICHPKPDPRRKKICFFSRKSSHTCNHIGQRTIVFFIYHPKPDPRWKKMSCFPRTSTHAWNRIEQSSTEQRRKY